MTNLAGHDLATLTETFRAAAHHDQPTVFLAYTIKGRGLPFAGHKDNHAGMMTVEQMQAFQQRLNIRAGHEWERFEGLAAPQNVERFIRNVPYAEPLTNHGRRLDAAPIAVPDRLPQPKITGRRMSTQAGFGEILSEIGRAQGESAELSRHILTTSPDVAVSTNLGPWINRRGVFDRHSREDVFRDGKLASAQHWGSTPEGQHRTRHRRAESVPPPRRRRASRDLTGAGFADRHGLRPVRQSRA